MSTQTGIVSSFNSKKLWTVPSKEQYLPAYFKKICDLYLKEANPRRLFPVECVGLQPASTPSTWVLGSNLHVCLREGKATRIAERESPYAVLGSELTPVPIINISDHENLDGGNVLKDIINIEREQMGDNFVPAMLVIGGMGLALHYEELAVQYDGAPLVMAFGLPVSGKSLAVQIAMSLIGEKTSIGESTQAGIHKLACSRTLPFWWDDVSDVCTLEALVVQAYNQSQRQTARNEKVCHPRSIPMMTMNPQCIYRKGKVDKEKISRIFSRIATIPFNKISGFQTLQGSLMLKASLQPLVSKAVLSVGTLLELKENFKHMQNDDLFKEVCTIVQESKLDMRSQLNYALLLFSTGKILEKISLDCFSLVKTYFVERMLPSLRQLLDAGDSASLTQVYSTEEQTFYTTLIERIAVECTAAPHEVRSFFIPKAAIKSKCKCGDVFGFKLHEVMAFIGCPERAQALKVFVTESNLGCTCRLTFPVSGQCSGCIHIPRRQLPQELLKEMDEAFLTLKNNVTGSSTNANKQVESTGVPRPTQTSDDIILVADGSSGNVEKGDNYSGSDIILVADGSSGSIEKGDNYSGNDAIPSTDGSPDNIDNGDTCDYAADSDEEKMMVDEELRRALDRAEAEERARELAVRSKGRKGDSNERAGKRRKKTVAELLNDGLSGKEKPLSGKRTRNN